jgi:hypothetical protein
MLSPAKHRMVHKLPCILFLPMAALERIERTVGRMREARQNRCEHLEKTADFVHKELGNDRRRWCEERPKRRAFAYDKWHGRPETIPNTWARMVY